MISKISIQNFQSHKDSELEFVPGVNVIIGPSDQGKSAIIRALRFVLENRPLGDDICSDWGGETNVTIEVQEGNTVSRIKDKDRNQYLINETVFKAFGHNPPEEVAQVLNMDDFNLQYQNEPPFMISLEPGQAAKVLNQAASISDIDLATKNIKSWKASAKTEKEQNERIVEHKTKELERYGALSELEGALVAVEQQERKLQNDQRLIGILEKHIEGIKKYKAILRHKKTVRALLTQIKEAEKIYREIEKQRQEKETLEQLQSRIKAGKERQGKDMARLEKLREEYTKAFPKGCPLLPDECPLLK